MSRIRMTVSGSGVLSCQLFVVEFQVKLRWNLALHSKIYRKWRVLVPHVQFLCEFQAEGVHSISAVQNGYNILPSLTMPQSRTILDKSKIGLEARHSKA